MNIAIGSTIQRGTRTYVVVECDEHQIKLQVQKNGRNSQGRPAVMTHARFKIWQDPRSVSDFADSEFVIKGSTYHLIKYTPSEERFTLRGVNDDGSYKRGRPRMMYIEDFTESQQERLSALLADM